MDSACGIDIQLVPQYPVVSKSVTLKLTGINGTIQKFEWYKAPVTDPSYIILSYIPSANPPQTQGPQYFSRASGSPDGSLQISDLLTTDQGDYTVTTQTDTASQQTRVNLPVYGKPVITVSVSRPLENETVTLTCNTGREVERILWSRVASRLPSGITFSTDNINVTFTNIKRSDSGRYQCEAQDGNTRSISDTYTLEIYSVYPPLESFAGILAVIAGITLLGIAFLICVAFLLYKKCIQRNIQPLRGQVNSNDEPQRVYYNVPGVTTEHNAMKEPTYTGLQYHTQDTYSELKS
ncbi:hypothetical protein GDO86_012293 [Hymenochirus boettgeri]|nr:hypothetical protein GDO86_012293 [Hymenochirus boettgeri]